MGNTNKYKFRYSGSYIVEDGATDNWKIKLLSSGTLYSANSLEIDAFLLGGGASGGSQAGGGGGGGYTKTEPGVTITENEAIPVIIGAGGKGVLHPNCGNDGEATLFGNISVAGGIGGNGWSCSKAGAGSGGSGGGCFNKSGAYGGSDGGNGFSSGSYAGGTGQGSTTREFGEADGTLYAGGGGGNTGAGGAGGGGAYGTFGVSGTRNTGGGGGGGGSWNGSSCGQSIHASGAGGSGIVVIRGS